MAKARCKQETFKPCEIPEMEVNAVFIDGVGGDGEAAEVIYPMPCRKQLMAQGLKMGTCRLLSPNLRADYAISLFSGICFCLVQRKMCLW